MPLPATDSTNPLIGVIVLLVGTCGWLFRKAYGMSARAVDLAVQDKQSDRMDKPIENGKRISRQEYISLLEGESETLRNTMKEYGPRMEAVESSLKRYIELLTTQQPQIDALEDVTTALAGDIRNLRQGTLRIENVQWREKSRVDAILVRMDELHPKQR